jgi:hypothetical protein
MALLQFSFWPPLIKPPIRSADASGNTRGVIWQNGAITDLNTLIPSDSPFVILFGDGINSSGQIAAAAFLPGISQVHAVLMIPAQGEAAVESVTPTAASEMVQGPTVTLPEDVRNLLKQHLPFGRFEGGRIKPQ